MTVEQLKDLGLSQEQIDDVMKLKGQAVQAEADKAAQKDKEIERLNHQLTEANQTIEEFKDLDVDAIKESAEEWKLKYEAAEADRQEERFTNNLHAAIREAGGRNPKAITALLDIDALRKSNDQTQAIANAIAPIKESDAYLFQSEDTPPEPVRVVSPGNSDGSTITREEIEKVEDTVKRRRLMAENAHLFK